MRPCAGRMVSGGPGVRTGWTPRRGQSRGPAVLFALAVAAAAVAYVVLRGTGVLPDLPADEVAEWSR